MLNKVIVMGRLAHTPEVKTSATSGTKIARIRIAVGRDIVGSDGVDVDFFDATAFGKTAEFAGNYLEKGRQIVIEGRLQTHTYGDKDGNKRTAVQIVADRLYFADTKKEENREPFLTEPPREIKPETRAFGEKLARELKEPITAEAPENDDLPF